MRWGSKISAVAVAAALLLSGCNNGIPTPESENVTRVADSTVVEAATTDADDLSVASSITTSDSSVTDNTDIFEQITDTSMPDPGISSMYGTYLDFSSPWKQRVSHVLLPLYSEQKERGSKWVKSKESVPTPYNLYNSMSLVSFCRDLDIPWESIEDNVRAWNGSVRYPAGTPHEEYEDIERFTEEELAALKTGGDETIVKLLASDYSIVVGENVFSPMWLYYHTVDDYKTAGIAPNTMCSLLEKYSKIDLTEETSNTIHSPLERYSKFDLTEEAWRAFRKKLILYAYSETCPDKDRIYTYETDISEPLGDDAFRIFEEFFYGEWECISNYENSVQTFDMTYNGSSFRFGRILGVFETDEIYVLHYNSGGTLECYVIEKSAPETMYSTDVLPSLGGIEEIKLGNDEPMKFINRKPAAAELKTGELSIPGLTYLFHIYGSDFEDYYREIIDRDGYRSISEDEELYLGNGYVLDNFTQYLVDMSEDNVTVALPYVHDKQESHQTAVYYELTFTKDANGEWSVEYAKSETYTTVYSFNGVEIPDELITEDGENYIRTSAAFIVSPVDGILSIVKHNDKYGNIVIRSCSSTLFKNEDNILEFGEQSAVVSEEVEVSGHLYIDRQNIDETYGRNGGIEFVPDGDTLPLFLSDRSREDNTGNPLFIGSIFESSPYYIGDEFADFMKNYNGGQVTVRLNNIRIALTANETDNSKATLMTIEGM